MNQHDDDGMIRFFSQPIPPDNVKKAEDSIKNFITLIEKVFDITFMTSKVHGLQHILDDCESQGCHLDYNSAYDAESFQGQWSKLIRSGNKRLEQIRLLVVSIN